MSFNSVTAYQDFTQRIKKKFTRLMTAGKSCPTLYYNRQMQVKKLFCGA